MNGPIIVCGLGHVGYRVLGLLQRLREPVFVIANNIQDEWRVEIESKNIPFLLGDASNPNLLIKAGIHTAKAIIIATDDDLANVSIVLDAKRLNPNIAIVTRFFDQRLATQLEGLLNINQALSTSYLAAPAFAASVKAGHVLSSFQMDDEPFNITRSSPESEIKIEVSKTQLISKFDGHPKNETLSDRLSYFLKSISTNTWIVLCGFLFIIFFSIFLFRFRLDLDFVTALYFVITIVTTVGFGDLNFLQASPWMKIYGSFLMLCGAALLACLFSIVSNFILSSRLQDLFGRHKAVSLSPVVVVGLGNVGYRITDFLRKNGENPAVIVLNKDEEFTETVRGWAPVIVGDPRSEDILLKANLKSAKALIAVTDNDVTNLSVGLAAKKLNPKIKVVLRMFASDLAEKVQAGFVFDAVLSTSAVSAPTFVGAALLTDVIHAFILEDKFFLVLRKKIKLGSDWIGQSIESIQQKEDVRMLLYKPSSSSSFSPILRGLDIQIGQEFIALATKALS